HFPADFVVVDFKPDPRVPLILGRCFLKTGCALIDVSKGELTLRIGNKASTYNLDQTSRYSANYDQVTTNKIDVTNEACEEYFQEVLGFSDVTASGSPTPSDDPIVSTTSPMLTLFGDSDFLLFEAANAFLGLEDDPDSPKLDPSYYDPEGDIQMLEAILNSDPAPFLPNHEQSVPSFINELKACEAKTIKSSVNEPPEVLKSHKRAIAWKLSDIQEDLKGITTRSGVAYQGPTIPTPSKVVKQGTEVTKDQVQTPNSQSTTHVQPPVTQSETPVSEPVVAPVSTLMPNLKPSIPYPSRRDNERR
nr:hypothetical protein [Tanacetum cinerariifolium]